MDQQGLEPISHTPGEYLNHETTNSLLEIHMLTCPFHKEICSQILARYFMSKYFSGNTQYDQSEECGPGPMGTRAHDHPYALASRPPVHFWKLTCSHYISGTLKIRLHRGRDPRPSHQRLQPRILEPAIRATPMPLSIISTTITWLMRVLFTTSTRMTLWDNQFIISTVMLPFGMTTKITASLQTVCL